MERLDKILANMGEGTRSTVRDLIRRGAVTVNGTVVRSPETKADPGTAEITVSGRNLGYRRYTYLMMNKAPGVLSATEDPKAETVLTCLPDSLKRRGLFPCGRLDKDAEGLLLLTNNGDWCHLLTSPSHHAPKTYSVTFTGVLVPEAEHMFETGITIDGGYVCRPAKLERKGNGSALITVHEGKFHQVKKMVAAAGGQVVTLKRLSFGPLRLDESIPSGGYRELTAEEEQALSAFCSKI